MQAYLKNQMQISQVQWVKEKVEMVCIVPYPCIFKLEASFHVCHCFNYCVQYNVGKEHGVSLVKLLMSLYERL